MLLAGLDVPFSEYSLANLLLYRGVHAYRFYDEVEPFVVGVTYDGVKHAMPLQAANASYIQRMLSVSDCLYPVVPHYAAGSKLTLERSEWSDSDSDYLYEADGLAVLRGARKKNAQARRFEEAVSPRLRPMDESAAHAAVAVLDGWLADVGKSAAETDYHNCREALEHLHLLDLIGWLVETGSGEPAGFVLTGHSCNGDVIFHYAKGRRKFVGVYPWMFASLASRFKGRLINFEQDLGNPRFAQSKRALAPCCKLIKYRIGNF